MAYAWADITLFLAYVKAMAWITTTDYDTQLTSYMKSALAYIKKATGQSLLVETITEYKDGAWERQVALNLAPVISITTLKYNGWTQATPSRITYDTDDFILDKRLWMLIVPAWLYRGFQNIEVIYVCGYAFASIPEDYEDLKQAVALMCINWLQSAKSAWLKSESVSWTSLVFDKSVVSDEVNQLLSYYKTINV